jgi:hypothetical protein
MSCFSSEGCTESQGMVMSFLKRYVCAYCADTRYTRTKNFCDIKVTKHTYRKTHAYDFMLKEQIEVICLEWLISDLKWLIKLIQRGRKQTFEELNNYGVLK